MGGNCKSCVGCAYLYQYGIGYSNYTWEDDIVQCAINRNSNLLEAKEPDCLRAYDWEGAGENPDPEKDNWPMTNNSRCAYYHPGLYIRLDVDGDDHPDDYTEDALQAAVISRHSGRKLSKNAFDFEDDLIDIILNTEVEARKNGETH